MAGGVEVVRVFPYPVLDEGNLSFPAGRYEPELSVRESGNAVRIKHRITGAELVERLIRDGAAAYCSSVSIPITGYREFMVCSDGSEQTVTWDRSYLGEPPYIRPMVVSTREVKVRLNSDDGVHNGWVGKSIHIHKGAKLAFGPFYRTASALQHLLVFQCDERLHAGQFVLDEPASSGGFYFRVRIADNLMRFLINPGLDVLRSQRGSILTHVVSCCFQKLKDDYGDEGTGEDGWQAYRNLVALNEQLVDHGIPPWSDPEFAPERAATALFPHNVQASVDIDEEAED